MKKIYFHKKNIEIFEIAKIIKSKFPEKRIFIHKISTSSCERIILKLPKDINRLEIEELKYLLKIKYPDLELSCNYF